MAEKKKKASVSKDISILQRELSPQEFLSTGSTQLDLAISCGKSKFGGIPTCRIIELSGTGASGKTYISGELSGDALRRGYKVYVDDIERRWDIRRLKTFGFTKKHKNFIYLKPSSTVEECFERLFRVADKAQKAKKKQKILYIIDPVAALIAEQEKKSDKAGQARAKAVQRNMRFLKDRVSSFADPQLTIIFSNQLIDNVQIGRKVYGGSSGEKKSPLGNAMRHWPSVRIRFISMKELTKERRGRVKGKVFYDPIGIRLRAKIIKNSEDTPHRNATVTIYDGYGIDDIEDNATWLKDHTKVLGKSGGWYKIPSTKKEKKKKKEHKSQQGLKKFRKYVERHNLEKRLRLLMVRHYNKWIKPEKRKPKVRF